MQRPPTSGLRPLLDRLLDDLDDEPTWEVLADRLDEEGDARAELIRLDLGARRARRRGDRETARRLSSLRSRRATEIGAPRGSWQRRDWPIVFGGFRIGVAIGGGPHVFGRSTGPEAPWADAFDDPAHPLTSVLGFDDADTWMVVGELTPPVIDRLRGLRLHVRTTTPGRDWLATLPPMPRVHRLHLVPNSPLGGVPTDVLDLALRPGWLTGLRHLDLSGSRAAGAVEVLSAVPRLRLDALGLARADATDPDLVALARWPGLPALRRLDLTQGRLTRIGIAALVDVATRLEHLDLRGCQLDDDAAFELARATLPRLRFLGLAENPAITAAGHAKLAEAPWFSAAAG